MYSHIDHVHAHLDRVRTGHLVDPSAESVYLGAEEGDHFWELVGLRLAGCPVVVLALLRFQRLDLPDIPHARESLATYLSALPSPRPWDEVGALTAILPPADQSVAFFLKRLRAGLSVSPVSLDPARIEVAFDFRLQNPTLIPDLRKGAAPLRYHVYRTVEGHLLRGRSHEIPAAATEEPHRFMAISAAEQITPTGLHPFPTLFVNRRFIALRALAKTREEVASLMRWVPFMPASAKGSSILPLPAVKPRAAAPSIGAGQARGGVAARTSA